VAKGCTMGRERIAKSRKLHNIFFRDKREIPIRMWFLCT